MRTINQTQRREIKFRAWHKEEKKMCPIDVLTTKGAFLIGVKNGPDELTDGGIMIIIAPKNGRFCMNEDIQLMQYTGLHDKNGKEIYEGDIIKTEWPKTNRNSVCTVEFINAGFMGVKQIPVDNTGTVMDFKYDPSWLDRKFHLTEIRCINYCEVIGDIYENPELINQNHE